MKKFLIMLIAFLLVSVSYADAANYIQNIKVASDDTSAEIKIETSNAMEYTVGKLIANKKIYFDFKDTIIKEKKTVNVNNSIITTIRGAQNATNPKYVSRVVLDMIELKEYTAVLSEDKKTLTITVGTPLEVIEKKIIVIDPGHGGKDPGAVISDLYEKVLNLDIAKRVQALLKEDKRFDVYMTRETDEFIELLNRAKFANDKKADLFVGIHNNSMPKGYSGTMVLYNASKNSGNKNLADIFQATVNKASGLKGIGTKSREDLVVLKNIEVPGILVEVACMSNLADRRALRKETFKQDIAKAIYNSIIQATL